MLPDFGSFYAQNIGTMPVHLFVSGANPMVMQSGEKLFAVTFVVEYDGQRMMGTIECGGNQADALKVAKELTSSGVYCQPRPDLAYTGIDGWQRVVPSFNLQGYSRHSGTLGGEGNWRTGFFVYTVTFYVIISTCTVEEKRNLISNQAALSQDSYA
jgi:hypothetical protein